MKRLLAVVTLFVLSCNQTATDQVKSFIPGSYSKKVNNEFSSGFDTLVISSVGKNVYRIIRYSSFSRIRNGKTMPLKRQSEIWTAIYNKEEQVLHETKKGKVITFLPEENVLMVGSSEFKKIEK